MANTKPLARELDRVKRNISEAAGRKKATPLKNRFKVWLVIEDLKKEEDVQDMDVCFGVGYRDTLQEAIDLVQSAGLQITEISTERRTA